MDFSGDPALRHGQSWAVGKTLVFFKLPAYAREPSGASKQGRERQLLKELPRVLLIHTPYLWVSEMETVAQARGMLILVFVGV